MWLYGKAGCGKTVLSSTIIEDIQGSDRDPSSAFAYYYFDFSDKVKASYSGLLRSLTLQFCSQHQSLWDKLYALYCSKRNGDFRPSDDELAYIVQDVTQYFQKVYLVLDALDECEQLPDLFKWFRGFHQTRKGSCLILCTSRDKQDIRTSMEAVSVPAGRLSIEKDVLNPDIELYVHSRLFERDDFRRWRDNDILPKVEREVMRKVDGM